MRSATMLLSAGEGEYGNTLRLKAGEKWGE
jgi:hypothetical protein